MSTSPLAATGIVFGRLALPESFAELSASAVSTYAATVSSVQNAQAAAYSAYSVSQYYAAFGIGISLTHPQETQDFISYALNVPGATYTPLGSYAGLAGWFVNYRTGIGFPSP